ncbi:DUF2520 domain-containing protein [Bacteroidales bacterium]|nr:DUF2520 domain-containing protein [Bacteroidales bacterium]
MKNSNCEKISIVGLGNVGWHLSKLLIEKQIAIHSIVSRQSKSIPYFIKEHNVNVFSDINKITDSDIIILCVSDHQIKGTAQQLKGTKALVVHTAGSVSIDELKNHFEDCGVLYPLQTFTKDVALQNPKFPFFIEASNKLQSKRLEQIVLKLENPCFFINSEERKKMHLAGVMLNNFTNYLLTASEQYLTNNNLIFEAMYPLLRETIAKAYSNGPMNSQTGPAIRNNIDTINKHISMLADNPQLQNIYRLISENIISMHR